MLRVLAVDGLQVSSTAAETLWESAPPVEEGLSDGTPVCLWLLQLIRFKLRLSAQRKSAEVSDLWRICVVFVCWRV